MADKPVVLTVVLTSALSLRLPHTSVNLCSPSARLLKTPTVVLKVTTQPVNKERRGSDSCEERLLRYCCIVDV